MTYHLPLPGGRHVSSGLWPCRAVVTTAPKLITSAKREMTIKTASHRAQTPARKDRGACTVRRRACDPRSGNAVRDAGWVTPLGLPPVATSDISKSWRSSCCNRCLRVGAAPSSFSITGPGLLDVTSSWTVRANQPALREQGCLGWQSWTSGPP